MLSGWERQEGLQKGVFFLQGGDPTRALPQGLVWQQLVGGRKWGLKETLPLGHTGRVHKENSASFLLLPIVFFCRFYVCVHYIIHSILTYIQVTWRDRCRHLCQEWRPVVTARTDEEGAGMEGGGGLSGPSAQRPPGQGSGQRSGLARLRSRERSLMSLKTQAQLWEGGGPVMTR